VSAIRIRGTWTLALVTHDIKRRVKARSLGSAQLKVRSANRSGLDGELDLAGQTIAVKGRVKPGSPAVITLQEVSQGEAVADGLQAIFYMPPWWPNVDYDYDLISGTLVVGEDSVIADKDLRGCLVSVTGVLPFD
jgi:hypothetical protein